MESHRHIILFTGNG